jgi:imidazolonepropionase-like amidohydrolase
VSSRDQEKAAAGRVFECGGLYAVPGLINCHVHALMPGSVLIDFDSLLTFKRQAIRNLEECPVHGVTTIRDASACSGVLNDLASKVEHLEVLGPRVIGCGASIKPPGGYPEFSKQLPGPAARKVGDMCLYATSPSEGREAVRRSVEQGARFIKLFFDDHSLFFGSKPLPVLDDDTVLAIIEEAHNLGRRVAVHQSMMSGFRRAVRLGVDDFEHMPVDAVVEPGDVESFMKGDHQITPTLSVGMALGIARRGHPMLKDPMVAMMQAWREKVLLEYQPLFAEPAIMRSNARAVELYLSGKAGTTMMTRNLFDPELFFDTFEKKNPNLHLLYDAGATICCGNDGGTPMNWPGMLSVEMQMLSLFRMSNIDILRSATINAAKLLDLETELGSLEPGKLADIVLLSDNPTRDIRAVERVEAVFRSGTLLHRGPAFMLDSQ